MTLALLVLIFFRPFIASMAFPYLNTVHSVIFTVISGTYIAYNAKSIGNLKKALYPIIFFCLAILISIVFSRNKEVSFMELYKYIDALLMFFVAAILSEENRIKFIRMIVLAGLIISLLDMYQYFFGFKHVLEYLRANGQPSKFETEYLMRKRVFLPFITPNVLAGYLAMIIPLILITKSRLWFMFPICLALILTGSIGVFLSILVTIIIYISLKGHIKTKAVLYTGILFLLILFIFLIRSLADQSHDHPMFSLGMRLSYWRDALAIIKFHPFVGIGIGNFAIKTSLMAHNTYLQIWAEMGLLGILSFILFICFLLYRKTKELLNDKITACLLASIMVFLVHNFVDFTFFLPEVAFIWWFICGLSLKRSP